MSTNSTRREQIARSLADKAYRDAFVTSSITIGLPSQIREMRLERGWNQSELGVRAGMRQALVSRFERKGYDGFTLSTLRKLASAFDVALKVRFVAFSEIVTDAAYPELTDLDVPSFDNDDALREPDGVHIISLIPPRLGALEETARESAQVNEETDISDYKLEVADA